MNVIYFEIDHTETIKLIYILSHSEKLKITKCYLTQESLNYHRTFII